MNEWIENGEDIITDYRGTYRGINWSITHEDLFVGYDEETVQNWKWRGGLRGSGVAESYQECKLNIQRVIDRSLERESNRGQ